jgi:hypothetical protein
MVVDIPSSEVNWNFSDAGAVQKPYVRLRLAGIAQMSRTVGAQDDVCSLRV